MPEGRRLFPNLSVDDMTADPDHATAYERRQGVVGPVPLRPVTALAPAGDSGM